MRPGSTTNSPDLVLRFSNTVLPQPGLLDIVEGASWHQRPNGSCPVLQVHNPVLIFIRGPRARSLTQGVTFNLFERRFELLGLDGAAVLRARFVSHRAHAIIMADARFHEHDLHQTVLQ